MDILRIVLPIVVGALVAGLSALVKADYERRDARLTAYRQLELATKRTEFVTGWLGVCRTIEGDAAFAASANSRARAELEEAYHEAQHAFAHSQSALTRSKSATVGQQLVSVLMLNRRKRRISYLAVALFYVLVLGSWASASSSDPRTVNGTSNDDYWAWWQYAIAATIATIVLRFVFGALVSWLERHGTPTSQAQSDTNALLSPASLTAAAAEPRA